MKKFVAMQTSKLFIDRAEGCLPLGVTDDDIDAAIGDSMRLCADIIDGRSDAIGMKGE